MKNTFIYLVIIVSFALISCNSSKTSKEQKQINALEKEVYSGNTLEKGKATQLIDLYIAFESQHRGDTMGAVYLFKAAELASSINSASQAILYYDRIIANYPTWSKTPDCLFLKGFIFENNLMNFDEAKKYYNEFLSKYPNHAYAKDAKVLIENMGLSPEELIRKFEQQNQTTN